MIVVLLIRSCGGDDEEAPVTPAAGTTGLGGATTLSQAEFVEQADAICLETNTALGSIDDSDPATAATEQARSWPASSTRCRRCRRRPKAPTSSRPSSPRCRTR